MIIFDEIDLVEHFNDDLIITDVRGRSITQEELEMIDVPGEDGSYLVSSRKPPRKLEVDISMIANSWQELRKKIDELNSILSTKEEKPIIFKDEPEMTYYGKLELSSENNDESHVHQATLVFMCPDPHKYGPEKTQVLIKNELAYENIFGETGNFIDDGTGNAKGWTYAQTVTYDFINQVATLTNSGYIYRDISGLDVNKNYLLMLEYTYENTLGDPMRLNKWDYGNFTGFTSMATLTPTAEYKAGYFKFTALSEFRFSIGVHSGTPTQTTKIKEVRLYEITQEAYDLIDIDPNYTGDLLLKKYSFVTDKHFVPVEENMTVNNTGTEESSPVFKATVLKPITNLTIMTDDEYMSIGRPVTVDDTVYSPETIMMDDHASTLVGWGAGGFNIDDGQVSGTMTTGGQAFYASDYGLGGSTWRGPAIIKSLSNSELIQDFEVKVMLMSRSPNVGGIGRAEAYLLSETMSVIGRLSVSMPSLNTPNLFTRIDCRGIEGKQMLLDRNWKNEHYAFILGLRRQGTLFTATVWQMLSDGTTRYLASEQFDDLENKYQTKLASIGLHVGAFGKVPTLAYNRIHHVLVYRLNPPMGVPYIAYEGDEIVLDHKNTTIRLNGDERKDLKYHIGANYFNLKPGENKLTLIPYDSVNMEMVYEEVFK